MFKNLYFNNKKSEGKHVMGKEQSSWITANGEGMWFCGFCV